MLGKRLLSSAIGLALLVVVLVSDKIVLSVGVALVIYLVLFELYAALGLLKEKSILAALGSMLPVIFVFMRYNISCAMYIYILALFVIIIIRHKHISISDAALTVSLTAIISFFLMHIISVRQLESGGILVWSIFIGAWVPDSAAYFAGKLAGKHKLAPGISPGKTVEGSLGGILGGVLGFCLFGFIVSRMGYQVNLPHLIILSVLASVTGQLGDLSASVLKRECGIKDFGNIMPGHGGIFDRFDSVIFVAPLVYYFIIYFEIIRL